eukprot:gene30675-35696_t
MIRAFLAPAVRQREVASRFSKVVFARGFATDADRDVVIIGGGPAGYVAAIKAGQLGLKTTCVEGRGSLGGTCLNVGCIPSKALLNSSHMYHDAKTNFANYGVVVDNVKVDWGAMLKQKENTVSGLTKGIEGLLKKNKVDYVQGWGKIKSPTEVEVSMADGTSQILKTKNILIATGSEVTPLPGLVIDEENMVVIGAGYIGLEMGSVYARLGTKVTVVEFLDSIVPTMDSEVRRTFMRTLEKQGLKFKMQTKVTKGEVVDGVVHLTTEPSKGGEASKMEADVVLVSIGRRPFTEGLGLETVGITTERGRITVDSHFRTNVSSIYAVGDVVPGPMLAHKAEEDGVAAVENIAGGLKIVELLKKISMLVHKAEEDGFAAAVENIT